MRPTMRPMPSFMLVTDRGLARYSLPEIVTSALIGGCRRVLFRDVDLPEQDYLEEARTLRNICTDYGAQFLLSRHAHLVKSVQADGVHLAAAQSVRDAREMAGDVIIGQSCHHDEEITRSMVEGADYITLGPVFATASKPGYGPAMGLELFHEMVQSCSVPVYAQGGILPEFTSACIYAGAVGVAVMGPIMRSEHPEHLVQNYVQSSLVQPDIPGSGHVFI